jgi:hypothetical protein
MIDKTESAVGRLKDWGNVPSKDEFDALLDRVIDAPVDADGNLLHMGDEVTSWVFDGAKRVTNFRLFTGPTWEACVGGGASCPCTDLHRVMPDSRERIEADAEKDACEYFGHGGNGYSCDGCQAGETTGPCNLIMCRDLLRRQRELDARKAEGTVDDD